MNKTNLIFTNEYEALNDACRVKFESEEGVAKYIAEMDNPSDYKEKVGTWNEDYNMLGKCKHIYNMIELGGTKLRKPQCTKQDIAWVKKFTQRIEKGTDPLAKLSKCEENARKIREALKKAKPAMANIALGCGVTLALTALVKSKKKK